MLSETRRAKDDGWTEPCVAGDAMIATPGGWRRADSVRPGDLILTVSGPRPVERVEIHPDTPLLRIEFSDGGSLRVTGGYRFHVHRGRDGFVPTRLDRCRVGDEVRTLHAGVLGEAKVLRIEPAGRAPAYDLYEPETQTSIIDGYVCRRCGE
jgi:hypothetical protein